MSSYEAREKQKAWDTWRAQTLPQELARTAQDLARPGDLQRTAQLNCLEQTLHDMLRANPDAWSPGFDPAAAAAACLPVLQSLMR
jgi:hypothetical protein